MIDLITVVFREELAVLKLQAQSIERYCQNINLNKIWIIVNDDTLDTNEIDTNWWGEFSDRVTIVHRSAWPYNFVDNGWLSQQVLKLLAADLCVSEWSVVLDAKTILVKPLDDINTKPAVGILDIYPVFEPSRKIVSELFDIELTHQLGPGGVPFILNNKLVKEMIEEITIRTNRPFASWFQEQGMVTEFILYSGYLVYKFGSFDLLYDTTHSILHPCNICHSEVPSFERKFKEMATASTVSIHRNAWSQLSSDQQQQYINFLNERGIQ